ncbi:MAG: DJ-1/PfpI family protein [Ruminococcus sp.]|jgi:4-methyl-5(b-hydroxyethyl)-thiazole monophosphate biosynthesis|nr:DJ-1/PfpI family protein [Ruminococcus sp.]
MIVYVFLADGFEEIEAICPIDILRRGNVNVVTVGVTGKLVTGSHGITVTADKEIGELDLKTPFDMIVLPGGMPGTDNLQANETVKMFITEAQKRYRYIAAICAAPKILGAMGVLSGSRVTCYPGYEDELNGVVTTIESVVRDGKIITAKGAGVALEFGFELLAALTDRTTAHKIAASMQKI